MEERSSSGSVHYGYEGLGKQFPHHDYVPNKLIKLLDKSKNLNILDLGCGNGYITRMIIEEGFNNIYGVDEDKEGIELAKTIHPDNFYVQDLARSIIPEELKSIKFDTIIASEVMEHLYSPLKFLSDCREILLEKNGGGNIIVSVPYHGYLKNIALSIFNKWDFHHTVLWDGGHIKFWSVSTLRRAFEQSGFKVTGYYGCGRFYGFYKSFVMRAEI